MFSVPQPPATESSQLPVIGLHDSPEALEMFLRLIYPTRSCLVSDADTLASILRLADKYDAKGVLDVYKDYLPPDHCDFPPIQMYAIPCTCGREKVEAVARRVPFASLKSLGTTPLLQLASVTQYQRLVSFMTAGDQRMREIVSGHREYIATDGYDSCTDDYHALYCTAIVAALQAAFEADPCVQVTAAFSLVSAFPRCAGYCKCNGAGVREYAEGLLQDLVEMAQNLTWGNTAATAVII